MSVPKQLQTWAYQPQERAAALEAGLTRYFTGRPCKNGHIAMRSSSSGTCIECSKKHQKQNAEKRLEKNPNWYKENYAKNPEQHRKIAAKYRENNPDKVRESYLKSIKKRKPEKAAAEMIRQAAKLQAMPKWLTPKHIEQIQAVYHAARQTTFLAGFPCHVDHIVPLRGKNVCGLHAPWNLRVVSQSYNSKKRNNLDDGVFYAPSMSGGVLIHSSALPWNWRK